MKLKLNKLKNDSQEIINNLQVTVDSLITIAFEYQTENEKLMAEIEKYRHIEQTVKDFWSELKKLSAFKDLQEPTLTELLEYIEYANAEAIKEFAERLKENIDNGELYTTSSDYEMTIEHIDNLVKEMVGDDNA